MTQPANVDPRIRSLLLGQFEVEQLLIDLTLIDKFLLDVVVVPTPRVARWLLDVIESEVPSRREEPLRVRCVEPDPKKARPTEPVTAKELIDDVLRPLLRPTPRPSEGFGVTWLDASTARSIDVAAWTTLFSRFNEQRDAIIEALGEPLLVVIPPVLEAVFAQSAPDAWSARSAVQHVKIADIEAHAIDVIDHPGRAQSKHSPSRSVSVLLAAHSEQPVLFDDRMRAQVLSAASAQAQQGSLPAEARALAERAVESARKAVEERPESLAARAAFAKALEQLDAALSDHGSRAERTSVAIEALENSERWARLAPETIEAKLALSNALEIATLAGIRDARETSLRAVQLARDTMSRSPNREVKLALAKRLSTASEFCDLDGYHDDAIQLGREAIALIAELNADDLLSASVSARVVLADVLMQRGQQAEALSLLLEAVTIADQHSRRAPGVAHAQIELILSHSRLAAAYHAAGDDTRALGAIADARRFAERALPRWPYSIQLNAWAFQVFVKSFEFASGTAPSLEEQRAWLACADEVVQRFLTSFAGDPEFESLRLRLEEHRARLAAATP